MAFKHEIGFLELERSPSERQPWNPLSHSLDEGAGLFGE